jgi:hypothetical protein
MTLDYISAEAWEHFRIHHPKAASFLMDQSLKGEYIHLLKLGDERHEWQEKRLRELAGLFKDGFNAVRRYCDIDTNVRPIMVRVVEDGKACRWPMDRSFNLEQTMSYCELVQLDQKVAWTQEDGLYMSDTVLMRALP